MIPTYRQVMLDWAIAELMSPHWRTVENWIWANPDWEPWRDRIRRQGASKWPPEKALRLIEAIELSRKPIIDIYGPRTNSTIEAHDFSLWDLGTLQVMPEFFPPGGTLRQLLDWILARPDYAPEKTAAIQAMKSVMENQAWPFGRLIAVERANGARVLIEGYKRALASLSAGRNATPAFLVRA